MDKKILLVATSSNDMAGHPTGLWLEELATPYKIFKDEGIEVEIASIKGGEVPLDKNSIPDGIPEEDKEIADLLKDTQSISDVKDKSFDAILFAGGHGPLQDFVGNKDVQNLILDTYKSENIVAAICHGVVAFVDLMDTDGMHFINGKKVTAFSDSEEKSVKLDDLVPFALESKLKEQGAVYEKGDDFTPYIVIDGNIITGQNPQSSEALGKKIVSELEKK
ncbi:type 1 glutamine amidotransferase domain-containing protein [Clostridium massiliamazoniense]|uniref:type 1 glutamine amidotransferase domain-containing protein n=1 Tax=Clostridium massiliamazoniense TaxID=1347366 RepID=UPI0006D7C2EE|nr:type 1 glutamine amidotransferase domain-containing protein [Clostridium massiliamazoniense]